MTTVVETHTTERRAPRGGARALAIVLLLSALAAAGFSGRQTIWLDEATQIEGIALGPVDVTRWLADAGDAQEWHRRIGYAVSPDRMPPLACYYHQAWAAAVGRLVGWPVFDPRWVLALRWSGVVCVAGAVALTFAMARRAYGPGAAIVAAALVGLSPTVVERAVEIRAYPLYLLLTTAAMYCAARDVLAPGGRARWLVAATSLGIASCYTHLEGVVFATALMMAMLVVERGTNTAERIPNAGDRVPETGMRRGRPRVGLLLTWMAATGLMPFVRHSVSVSGNGYALSDRLLALADLAWSFAGHRIHGDAVVFLVAAAVGGLVLLVAVVRSRPAANPLTRLLLLTLGIGLAAVTVASFAVASFKPALCSYNLWMFPVVAIAGASALRSAVPRVRGLATIGVVLVLSAHAAGATRLALAGERVAHGADPRIVEVIRERGVHRITVVHDAGSLGTLAQVYYPLAYFTRGAVSQYIYDDQAAAFWGIEDRRTIDPSALETDCVIVVRAGPGSLLPSRTRSPLPYPMGIAAARLAASPRWRLAATFSYAAMFRMTTWVFEKVPASRGLPPL